MSQITTVWSWKWSSHISRKLLKMSVRGIHCGTGGSECIMAVCQAQGQKFGDLSCACRIHCASLLHCSVLSSSHRTCRFCLSKSLPHQSRPRLYSPISHSFLQKNWNCYQVRIVNCFSFVVVSLDFLKVKLGSDGKMYWPTSVQKQKSTDGLRIFHLYSYSTVLDCCLSRRCGN